MHVYLRYLLQLVLSPKSGWADIAAANQSPRLVVLRLAYPMIALAALTEFVQVAYHSYITFVDMLMKAAVVFTSYFVGLALAKAIFPSLVATCTASGELDERGSGLVVGYTVSLLALATVVSNLLPMSLGLQIILPLAFTLIAWKADAYLQVTEKADLAYVGYVFACITLPPILIQMFFDWILSL